MKVTVTGSSGLVGGALVTALRASGHEVVRLVRRDPQAPDETRWRPRQGWVDPEAMRGTDAVINLAGPGMGDRPWTPARKRMLLDDRVSATTTITRAMAESDPRPATLLSMSGVGIYGNPGDTEVDETAALGRGYVAHVAEAWERATAPAEEAGIRVVQMRSGVVLSARGGAFGRLLPVFRLGLGGRLGSGRQWWSWVALDDLIAAMQFLLQREDMSGAVNVTAPQPVRNAEVTQALGRALHRPTLATVPGWALRLPLRDFADDLLRGQRVVPRRLLAAGFTFEHPSFEPALRAMLAGA